MIFSQREQLKFWSENILLKDCSNTTSLFLSLCCEAPQRRLMKLCREQCRVVYGEIKAAPRYKETFVSVRGGILPHGTPKESSSTMVWVPAERERKKERGREKEGDCQRDSVFKNIRNPSSSPVVVSRRVKEGEESREGRERERLVKTKNTGRSKGGGGGDGGGTGDRRKGIRPRGITMRSNVVNINETKVISVFLFFFILF